MGGEAQIYQLYLTARNRDKARAALGDEITQSPRVHLLDLDLDLESLTSVRACAERILSLPDTLSIFIGNAGVMAMPEGRTGDGFEMQFGSNYLGHFLLFVLLRPALLAGAEHLANEIDRRHSAQGIRAFSVQPGGIRMGLLQHMSEEEQKGLADDPALGPQFTSPGQGAATSDVRVADAWDEGEGRWAPGYFSHAYFPEKGGRLWEVSMGLVGVQETWWRL
ncbi:hypothetical protein BJY00DRAFT_325592 [Aspergillus carlsbadensis]|nr:hypothetical protein BJY00DRAFT_325592 [Aspergillus carlsbadensis]